MDITPPETAASLQTWFGERRVAPLCASGCVPTSRSVQIASRTANLRRSLADGANVVAMERELPHPVNAKHKRGAFAPRLTPAELELAQIAAVEDGPAVLVVTVDGPEGAAVAGVLWANAAAKTLLGQSLDDTLAVITLGSLAGGLPHPNNWTAVAARLIAAGDAAGDEWHTATLDAPDAPDELVRLRIRDLGDSGLPNRYLVWLRPSSDELRDAEEAAADAEYQFRALGENAPIGIVVSDVGLRLAFANDGIAAIVDVDRTAMLGTGWLSTVFPEDLPGLLETLEDVLNGTPAELTLRLCASSGSQRWVQLRLAPITTHRRAAGFVGTIEDITERRDWESQLTYQAAHDALTGLANRRELVSALAELFAGRRVADRQGALLFCDVDGFKYINDTFGHDAGDRVLIEIARRMSATARDDDLIARIAGDEFVVLLRQTTSRSDAEAAAARQLAALGAVIHLGNEDIRLSASIGIAMTGEYEDASAVLRGADAGMYAAKRSGRGLVRYDHDHGGVGHDAP